MHHKLMHWLKFNVALWRSWLTRKKLFKVWKSHLVAALYDLSWTDRTISQREDEDNCWPMNSDLTSGCAEYLMWIWPWKEYCWSLQKGPVQSVSDVYRMPYEVRSNRISTWQLQLIWLDLHQFKILCTEPQIPQMMEMLWSILLSLLGNIRSSVFFKGIPGVLDRNPISCSDYLWAK